MTLVFASDERGLSFYNLCMKRQKSNWAFVDVRDERDLFSQKNAALFINLPGSDRRSDIHLLQPNVGISTHSSSVLCHLSLMKNGYNISNNATFTKTLKTFVF